MYCCNSSTLLSSLSLTVSSI
jgi:hypothetical protein